MTLDQEMNKSKEKHNEIETGIEQPVNKKIKIKKEHRNFYFFDGVVVHHTFTKINGDIKKRLIIQDKHGKQRVYDHPEDIPIKTDNKVAIVSIDNVDNDIGIVDKDCRLSYYRNNSNIIKTEFKYSTSALLLCAFLFLIATYFDFYVSTFFFLFVFAIISFATFGICADNANKKHETKIKNKIAQILGI